MDDLALTYALFFLRFGCLLSLVIQGWLNLELVIFDRRINLEYCTFYIVLTLLLLLIFCRSCCWNDLQLDFIDSKSAFFHSCMRRLAGLDLFAEALGSTNTILWSLRPGRVVQHGVNVVLLVKKMSRMLSFRVGWVTYTICCISQVSARSRSMLFILVLFWCPSTVLDCQLMSGRLKSTPLQNTAFLNIFSRSSIVEQRSSV